MGMGVVVFLVVVVDDILQDLAFVNKNLIELVVVAWTLYEGVLGNLITVVVVGQLVEKEDASWNGTRVE